MFLILSTRRDPKPDPVPPVRLWTTIVPYGGNNRFIYLGRCYRGHILALGRDSLFKLKLYEIRMVLINLRCRGLVSWNKELTYSSAKRTSLYEEGLWNSMSHYDIFSQKSILKKVKCQQYELKGLQITVFKFFSYSASATENVHHRHTLARCPSLATALTVLR